MAKIKNSKIVGLVLIALSIAVAGPVYAEKPSWAGGGKHEKHSKGGKKHEKHAKKKDYSGSNGNKGYYHDRDYDDRDRAYFSGGTFFGERHRAAIRDYYDSYARKGNCPPGLAKKNNGCMPPGQAKKWAIGQPLPRDMAYSDLSADLTRRLGLPPQGYRYVQSASDVLMINGAGIVRDAINNWGR